MNKPYKTISFVTEEEYEQYEEIIEKSKPRKPMAVWGAFDNVEHECPWCGNSEHVRSIYSYCPWCGQALKWGD